MRIPIRLPTRRETILMIVSGAIVAAVFAARDAWLPPGAPSPGTAATESGTPAAPPAPDTPFRYSFNTDEVLYEAGSMDQSTSPYWWVDSGAELILSNGTGSTILGSLPANDYWRLLYARNNPLDTDNGYHPQNLFRLVTKGEWTDYVEQAYFKIDAVNLSASPNRNQSNGLLLFSRYADAFNLYYAGVRVDGNAVIKKKMRGTYYTMALTPIFPGTYDPLRNPNLIPVNTWIGLRTSVATGAGGAVSIKLYLDVGRTGNWILAAQATDDGSHFGGPPIGGPAHLGIRTDFMDVEFGDFQVDPLGTQRTS